MTGSLKMLLAGVGAIAMAFNFQPSHANETAVSCVEIYTYEDGQTLTIKNVSSHLIVRESVTGDATGTKLYNGDVATVSRIFRCNDFYYRAESALGNYYPVGTYDAVHDEGTTRHVPDEIWFSMD